MRHPRVERRGANDERDAACVAARGGAPPARRSWRLRGRRRPEPAVPGASDADAAVEDAGPAQRLERREAEPAGSSRRSRGSRRASARGHRGERCARTKRSSSGRELVTLSMKTKRAPRIHACSCACCARRLAADPAREAEVVADQRAGARLTADPARVDDHRAEPFRGAVDGCRQARRPGAHDHEVELLVVRAEAGARRPRELCVAGSVSAVPSGRTTTGSGRFGVTSASRSPALRRVGEARSCAGSAQRSRTLRSS